MMRWSLERRRVEIRVAWMRKNEGKVTGMKLGGWHRKLGVVVKVARRFKKEERERERKRPIEKGLEETRRRKTKQKRTADLPNALPGKFVTALLHALYNNVFVGGQG